MDYAQPLGGTTTRTVGGRTARSHVVTINAPGAVSMSVTQRNNPRSPRSLAVVQTGASTWQARTRDELPSVGAVSAALIFITVRYADGQVVHSPPLDRLLDSSRSEDQQILALDRDGLRVGDRRPRWVASSQTVNFGEPDVQIIEDGSPQAGGAVPATGGVSTGVERDQNEQRFFTGLLVFGVTGAVGLSYGIYRLLTRPRR